MYHHSLSTWMAVDQRMWTRLQTGHMRWCMPYGYLLTLSFSSDLPFVSTGKSQLQPVSLNNHKNYFHLSYDQITPMVLYKVTQGHKCVSFPTFR